MLIKTKDNILNMEHIARIGISNLVDKIEVIAYIPGESVYYTLATVKTKQHAREFIQKILELVEKGAEVVDSRLIELSIENAKV